MRIPNILLLSCLAALVSAQNPPEGPRNRGPRPASSGPRLSSEEYEPKSTLVVPQHPRTRAKYPLIDVHNHQNGAMPADRLEKLVKDMDGINLQVMVNLSGGYGDRLAQAVQNMKGHYKNRFVAFANCNLQGSHDPDYARRAAAPLDQAGKSGAPVLELFKTF